MSASSSSSAVNVTVRGGREDVGGTANALLLFSAAITPACSYAVQTNVRYAVSAQYGTYV